MGGFVLVEDIQDAREQAERMERDRVRDRGD